MQHVNASRYLRSEFHRRAIFGGGACGGSAGVKPAGAAVNNAHKQFLFGMIFGMISTLAVCILIFL